MANLIKVLSGIPAPVRHAALLLLASLVSWAVTSNPEGSFATGVGAYVLAWVTPLVQSYGVGKALQSGQQ